MPTSEYKTKKLRDKGLSERDVVLISMKQNKKEAEELEVPSPSEEESYPYGLTIDLDNDSLEKLGIDTLKKVGETCEIKAVAKVKRSSESESEDGVSRNLCLQITEMAID